MDVRRPCYGHGVQWNIQQIVIVQWYIIVRQYYKWNGCDDCGGDERRDNDNAKPSIEWNGESELWSTFAQAIVQSKRRRPLHE